MRVRGHPAFTEVNIADRLYVVLDGVIHDLKPEHYPQAHELGFREYPPTLEELKELQEMMERYTR